MPRSIKAVPRDFDLRFPPCLSRRPYCFISISGMRLPFRSYPNFRAFPLAVMVLSFIGRIVVASGRLDARAQSRPWMKTHAVGRQAGQYRAVRHVVMNCALQSVQLCFGRRRRSDSPYGAQILACASSLHVVHYNSAFRSCRMKPPRRVHAVLWFRGALRIPDERQSSRLSKPRAPLERERSHIGGGSDGAGDVLFFVGDGGSPKLV